MKGHSVQKQRRLQKEPRDYGYETVLYTMRYNNNLTIIIILQLRVCGMTKKRNSKGYCKTTEYVEVRVPATASYTDVATVSKGIVGLSTESVGVLTLFRIDGTVIPDSHVAPWTIDLKKSSSQIKLGVRGIFNFLHTNNIMHNSIIN